MRIDTHIIDFINDIIDTDDDDKLIFKTGNQAGFIAFQHNSISQCADHESNKVERYSKTNCLKDS